MTEKMMTIREMCDTYEVTPRTLRFYEAKELLFPVREGQKRLFTKQCRARMALIQRGKRYGISLEDIRQLLDLYEQPDGAQRQLVRSVEVARDRLAELRRQQEELTQTIGALITEIAWGEDEMKRSTTQTAA
ncbi:MerR family DNA-binding transcriptional regulator [Frigidibacter sp. MR17.14]|uniref:MerR family transcriptional regulator n=1 Tax=Frigidibacter sp. MR17.14 TaxID=3126509 RepID=UPI003012A580